MTKERCETPMTARAKSFMATNRAWPVVSGAWLDNDRRPVTGPPETWVKKRYRLVNGQQFTLNQADLACLNAIGFRPIWLGVKDHNQ